VILRKKNAALLQIHTYLYINPPSAVSVIIWRMIVVFGASSDIGRRATAQLLDAGLKVRLVARDPSSLDDRAERATGDISMASRIAHDAEQVVSCAHARFVPELIEQLPLSVKQLVLIGSAWRYSNVRNPLADKVRTAERAFVSSGRSGVMLHPTMIYGGSQERNLQRLLTFIRRSPVIVMPGGGRHLVQPVHVDDVAACIYAAVRRPWEGANVIPVVGPKPIQWQDMARACIMCLDLSRIVLPVPLAPAIHLLALAEWIGLTLPLKSGVLRRFREDVNLPTALMQSELGISPRPFEVGLRQALAEWAAIECVA
jgi:nucleoside-diphosphate-sugar epimerase